ncbi:PAS and ANTAR domain-containing protein [Nocardioides zeicaulis]|uniref:histidine kinase n=1 Tax=Nocardioides zeicaulis TaxID=1776857 RepID=A0ABV6E352_9ACTN
MNQRVPGGRFSASHDAVVGLYTYHPDTDRWTWSDEVYRIHGFDPGAVVPTTELVMSHIHPEDREAGWRMREVLLEQQKPITFLHRIRTARGDERVVMAAGHPEREADGTLVVKGHLIDLTDVRRDAVAAEVDTTVQDFTEHRAVIEQAKGVLAQLYSVETETAFALLKAFSSDANVRVRDIATNLVAAASVDGTPTKGRSPSAHDMLTALRASDAWR